MRDQYGLTKGKGDTRSNDYSKLRVEDVPSGV